MYAYNCIDMCLIISIKDYLNSNFIQISYTLMLNSLSSKFYLYKWKTYCLKKTPPYSHYELLFHELYYLVFPVQFYILPSMVICKLSLNLAIEKTIRSSQHCRVYCCCLRLGQRTVRVPLADWALYRLVQTAVFQLKLDDLQ